MIKLLLMFGIFMGITVFADDIQLEAVIFNKVLSAVTKKEHPKVYIYKNNKAIKTYPGSLELTPVCKEADIIVISTLQNFSAECTNKILFGTKYSHLQDKRVIGAFFWQKGRPNILFYQHRLEKQGIHLDANFQKYIEK